MVAERREWPRVADRLRPARGYWLGTTGADGAPHTAPGRPHARPDVLSSLAAKYDLPGDARYLPSTDPDFDVLWALRPTRALMWRLVDYDSSQACWSI